MEAFEAFGATGMVRAVLIIGSLIVLVAAGVVEGLRSNRWGASEELRSAAAKLSSVPASFGSWVSKENPVDRKVLETAEAVGSVSRVYQDKSTGVTVSVLLLCGPSGPIGAHTPDICYAGLGYQMVGHETRKVVPLPDQSTPSYWSARFKKGAGEAELSVAWAWGVDGDWGASQSPRREFALQDYVYKLYASRALGAGEPSDAVTPDATQGFLTEFLPEVKRALGRPAG